MSPADPHVEELGFALLKLRDELVFTPQAAGNETYYMVEDRLNSRFFRLGLSEYTFVSLLDGQTTVHDALAHLSSLLPKHCLTLSDATAQCRWLAGGNGSGSYRPIGRCPAARRGCQAEFPQRTNGKLNPLIFRVPLGSPDQVLA